MVKKWLIIGLPSSGKTTIAEILEGEEIEKKSSQEIRYRKNSIEVPGMFLENNWMHSIIITVAQNQAKGMFLLMDGAKPKSHYSPGFSQAFNIPVIGVVTKCDEGTSESIQDAERKLLDAGTSKILRFKKDDIKDPDKIREFVKEIEESYRQGIGDK